MTIFHFKAIATQSPDRGIQRKGLDFPVNPPTAEENDNFVTEFAIILLTVKYIQKRKAKIL
jgi:hypothetical protein